MAIGDSGLSGHGSNHVESTPSPISKYVQDPIAIVGIACRLPGDSNSPRKLWELLERGGVAQNEAPASRFNLQGHHDGSKKPKTMRSPGGMFLENVDPQDFDAPFFGISRTDAIAMDPQQRQLLEVVYECLENAGLRLDDLDGAPIGCFVGSYAVDYADIQARDPEDRAPSITVGVGRAILSNRISHFLNIKGPSMTIDTACSGSLVSVDVACRYLQTGEINGAIIAGANLYLNPEHNMDGGAMKGASSLSGKCHTFDVKADGYIKAEGINAIIIKRLDDAIRDGDPIRAVIRGSATNSDGKTPGIASPSSEAQATAIRAAYANAGISDFNQTSYLECHGTGTQVCFCQLPKSLYLYAKDDIFQAGDPTEVAGASSVFADSRRSDDPLIIGSVKSNIGHSEPAAGISGVLNTVLAIESGIIPGNPTFVTPNPKIDFHTLRVHATRTAIPWPNVPFRRASVNSFGYGGSNAHVILEEPKMLTEAASIVHVSSYMKDASDLFLDDETDSTRPFTLVFSSNDETSLQSYCKAIRKHLVNPNVKVSLEDLSYTLSERRTQHFNRAYVVTKNTSFSESEITFGKKSETPKLGFVFTGQGAQWSQMGKELCETFPVAKLLLKHLDDVLQSTLNPPSWSLYNELVEPRNPATLREPEFSQPLVTALQLAILAILEDWDVSPQSVVGHSSGEIAAAYAAGYLSKEDAIKVAYYRGQAAKDCQISDKRPVGMLAVGLGPTDVSKYLQGMEESVHIAYFNSPQSVTLSGTLDALEEVKKRLVKDHHFARLLQVNLAYHSKFMAEIGDHYEGLLLKDFESLPKKNGDCTMFSSVTAEEMNQQADASYWKSNMVCPARFGDAVEKMISGREGANFLIEIGPSGALAGPIGQIKKAISGNGANTQYFTALSRGQDSVNSLFKVAGQLFVSGATISLRNVNKDGAGAEAVSPKVIVDLPNYTWNHSTQYWYENDASNDWRNRLFPHHDLLGSKVLGTSWHLPSWRKILRVEDLSWLKDHKMGPDIVFPAAAFMAMAVEAVSQRHEALCLLEEKKRFTQPCFKLRDLTFAKALVLEEGKDHKIMLTLTPHPGPKDSWFDYKVLSSTEGVWNEHSRGLIRLEEGSKQMAPEDALKPLQCSTPGSLWYKAMHDAGYNFGTLFQKQLEVESVSGQRQSRSIVSLTVPESTYPQSSYPIHPACIDGCLQTCAPSLWKGNRAGVSDVLVPAIIDEIVITTSGPRPETAVSITKSKHNGLGRLEETKNYVSYASVYDQATGDLLFQVSGLRYHKLDTRENPYAAHNYSRVIWKPDITWLSQEAILKVPSKYVSSSSGSGDVALGTVNEIIDLVSHKKPNVKVMEVNMISGDSSSMWLDGSLSENTFRAASRAFHFVSPDAKALIDAQEIYSAHGNSNFDLLDISKPAGEFQSSETDFDLVVVRIPSKSTTVVPNVLHNARTLLSDGGHVLLLEQIAIPSEPSSEDEFVVVNNKRHNEKVDFIDIFAPNGFDNTRHIYFEQSNLLRSAYLSAAKFEDSCNTSSPRCVDLIHLTDPSTKITIREELKQLGWQISEHFSPFDKVQANSTVLVLDDLYSPLLPSIREDQWESLKILISKGSRILWVTEGSQLDVSNPNKAMIHGLARTIRAEDPSVSLTTLDVESTSGSETLAAIDSILKSLGRPPPKKYIENEFVEREGVLHISRVQPDHLINHAEKEDVHGADVITQSLHDTKNCVRLRCDRLGTIDSLCYTEVAATELPVDDNCVEVELAAAGLNFKDVAITMGIVPENQYLLGLEGAGVVRRVGKLANDYKAGQRVLIFKKGTFANRSIATTERVHHIPDTMSFEEASTLPSVYLTAIFSVFDLANTKKGDRVLIHSASGGLGIACIQLCQYLEAEVFVTVGNEEKRKFLMENFGIPSSNIFNSRSTVFASELMQITNGYGVDVILNSLTGDLLDASWRCIAPGGTMVELGKKDMLDRNHLSMEPFGRNASYRCFDMSHEQVTDKVIGRLMTQMFDLLRKGYIKPIFPIKTFSFEDIPSAFRYMRSANHIGKIVISNGGNDEINVPIRAAPRTLELKKDRSTLIIGGLRGLCGSLAIYLAGLGVKHIVVLSRSGYADERSQGVLKDISAQGCKVVLVKGDVSIADDVRQCFKQASAPVGGIIQGAMVLRDKIYTSMTIKEYYDTITSKVQGTWNLHNIAQEEKLDLDFFTMLSSVSGVVGQKGQANYAAANVFLDAFAVYRRKLGLKACSVDLGAIEDVGYMSEHKELVVALDSAAWTPINEGLFLKILRFSILQQISPINDKSAAQMITSIAVPQQEDSKLLVDARFAGLCFGNNGGQMSDSKDGSKEIQAFLLMMKSQADSLTVLNACIEIVNRQFMTSLRLSDPMEPGKPLSSYGLDSLAAVEFRNWVRMDLGAELTTLEITNATSLTSLCEKIISKITSAAERKA